MARFNLLLSLYLAVYLRKVTAGYNQWSDLPVCAVSELSPNRR